MDWLELLENIGLMSLGATFGIFIMAICNVSSNDDKRNNRD